MRRSETLPQLRPRQERAAASLAIAHNVRSAALGAGVSRASIYRWLGDPAFQQRLQQLRQQAHRALEAEMAGDLADLLRRQLQAAQITSDASLASLQRLERRSRSVTGILRLLETSMLIEEALLNRQLLVTGALGQGGLRGRSRSGPAH